MRKLLSILLICSILILPGLSAWAEEASSRILVVYFSVPEDVDTAGVDAVSGASIVVRDGGKLGNIQFAAQIIARETGADLFRLETVEPYPLDHDPLVDQAAQEQDDNARPELTALPDLSGYDTVFLGYPNWWASIPMPIASFLEEYDFSGKTIVPFCSHGGGRFGQSLTAIAKLAPNAELGEGLSVHYSGGSSLPDDIAEWLEINGLKD